MSEQPPSRPRILIADDSKVVRLTISKYLSENFEVLHAEDGVHAMEVLRKTPGISVLFTDLGMPNMDGYELIKKVRAEDSPKINKIPIVVVTAADDSEKVKDKVLALGATDLISKPFDASEVKSRAASYSKYNSQVAELEKHQAQDPLTGLSTKEFFLQQAEKAIAFARRHGHEMTVVRICIDEYSQHTQKLGKPMMGKIIKMVAGIFSQSLREEDDACWLGGEHFVLALPGTDPDGSGHALRRVREKTANINLRIGGAVVHIGFSIGTASQTIDRDNVHFADLMKCAETAMRKAIAGGGGRTEQAPPRQAAAPAVKSAAGLPDVSIDELLALLAEGGTELSQQQLVSAMRKFMPLMKMADDKLKLGLAKVVMHIEGRLR